MEAAPLIDIEIDKLVEYAQQHFTHEEKLLELNHYPEITHHRSIHQDFTYKINILIKDMKSADENNVKNDVKVIASDLIRYLFQWLVEHIMEEDIKYSALLKMAGAR